MNARSPRTIGIIAGVIFLALLGLLLYGVAVSDRPDRQSLPSPLLGKPAPAFSLPVLGEPERQISSEDLLGAPYLMNVWGSWCPAITGKTIPMMPSAGSPNSATPMP